MFFFLLTNFGLIHCFSNLKDILDVVLQYSVVALSCMGEGLVLFFRVNPAFSKAIVLIEFPDGKVAIMQVLYMYLKYHVFKYFLSFKIPSNLVFSYYFNIFILGGI
jgi:hypothetical protein